MSAEIGITQSGVAEMAYVGKVPWHGLGQRLVGGASIEEWKQQAGMAWKIRRAKVRFPVTPEPQFAADFREIPDQHVLFRADNEYPLGIVSSGYKVVQPGEVLEFFREMVATNDFELDTAGTLFGGKRFWALARINASAEIARRDTVGGFLLLSSSADGTLSTEARFTSVRVVCNNTLKLARGAAADYRVTHRSVFNADACKKALGVGRQQFADFRDEMIRYANLDLNRAEREAFVIHTLGDAPVGGGSLVMSGEEIDKVRDSAAYQKIMQLFVTGRGAQMDGVHGTGWGALNAITEYVDHEARARGEDNRFVSGQMGRGALLKDRARSILATLI